MWILVTLMLLLLVVVAVAAVAGGMALARSSKSKYHSANEVVPGTPTRAPAEWAGAHSTEARLHRRLRDAVAAMNANPALADLAFSEARRMVEQEALAIDDRLVAAAALPVKHRVQRLPPVAAAVEALEGVVAEMVDASASTANTDAALAAVRTRLELVAQARDELAGLEASSPQMQELREGLEAGTGAADQPPPAPDEGEQPPGRSDGV